MWNKTLFRFAGLFLFSVSMAVPAMADSATGTLEFVEELPVGGSLDVENLLGSVTIRGGGEERTARVEARIVADAKTEKDARELVDSIRLESSGEAGNYSVQIVFPVERHSAFRSPRSEKKGVVSKWITPAINRDIVAVQYGGRMIRVGHQKGAAAVSVELIITVPMDVRTNVRQFVGSIDSATSRGEMHLEVIEGWILADQLYGTLHARSGGGRVAVTSFHGEELGLQTDSGNLELMEIETDRAQLTTGSGKIQISGITANELQVESSSGKVEMQQLLPGTLSIRTATGDIDLAPDFKQMSEALIESTEGDVTLRVSEISSFYLQARTKSGEVKTKGLTLTPQQPEEGAVGFRAGTGGPRVRVNVDDGELTVRRDDS